MPNAACVCVAGVNPAARDDGFNPEVRKALRVVPGGPQSLHHVGGASHLEEGAVLVGALFQHLAVGEDFAAQLLGRPGQEELGLDQIPLEEADDDLPERGDLLRAARAHHDAVGVAGLQ
jgi:hypothetical protein